LNRLDRLYRHLPALLTRAANALGRRALTVSQSRRIVRHEYCGHSLVIVIADREAKEWYDHDWTRLPEIDFLRDHQLTVGARIFDLGAHQGVLAAVLAKTVGSHGCVIGVDPVAHNVKLMAENAALNRLNNLVPVQAAVARTVGTVKLSGFLTVRVTDRGNESPAVTVDGLASRYGAPDVIIVDVEGYEVEVLAGATGTLECDSPPDWIVECHVGCGLEECGGSVPQVAAAFAHGRYELFASRGLSDAEFIPYERAGGLTRERFLLAAIAR
jgi:FkbM family methyltransferase